MQVSIIIPNYNGAELLESCLESISNQSYTNYEVIVIDNGSTDDSLSLLSHYRNWVNVICLGNNEGFSKAINHGIKNSSGELVFVLNNDTVIEPNCVAAIVEGVMANPSYGFYAPLIFEQANPNQVYAIGLMFSQRGYGNRSQRKSIKDIKKPIEVFGTCGAAAIYRKKVLDEIGLFNEEFFFLYEDLELSFRHQLYNYKCLYLPSAIVYHHGSATLSQFHNRAVYEAIKNSLITLITCSPSTFLKKYIVDILKFYKSFWREAIHKGYTRQLLKAIFHVLTRLPAFLTQRKSIQDKQGLDMDTLEKLLYRGDIYINFPNGTVKI